MNKTYRAGRGLDRGHSAIADLDSVVCCALLSMIPIVVLIFAPWNARVFEASAGEIRDRFDAAKR